MFIDLSRENLRLKDQLDQLQKQLVQEQLKTPIKSPISHSLSGKHHSLLSRFFNFFLEDELSILNNNNSIDRFLRNVTAGLSDPPALVGDLSGTFDDGSSGGEESSRTMSTSNQNIRPLIPLRVRFSDRSSREENSSFRMNFMIS